jgi:UDP-N-acetyl-D-mannosaminuronate dehydrogenase
LKDNVAANDCAVNSATHRRVGNYWRLSMTVLFIERHASAMARAAAQLSGLSDLTFVNSAYEACEGSDALLILTEWQEFKAMDLKVIRETLRLPIVIDGRNLLIAEEVEAAGLVYYSMGRQTAHDQPAVRVTSIAKVVSA